VYEKVPSLLGATSHPVALPAFETKVGEKVCAGFHGQVGAWAKRPPVAVRVRALAGGEPEIRTNAFGTQKVALIHSIHGAHAGPVSAAHPPLTPTSVANAP
jgi:hypothetical protein